VACGDRPTLSISLCANLLVSAICFKVNMIANMLQYYIVGCKHKFVIKQFNFLKRRSYFA
jgi:hypothetical protein